MTALHIELDSAIKKALPKSTRTTDYSDTHQNDKNLLKSIRQELNLFENGGKRGLFLTKAYECLLSIRPTSIESERAFSSAGYICSKIRSRMNDDTLDNLCFLRAFFQIE
jgi:hAT family C-terminal dimerisation region